MKIASNRKRRTVTYRRSPGEPVPEVVKANVEELLARSERRIDTSDIPELPADAWKHAVRGRFNRLIK